MSEGSQKKGFLNRILSSIDFLVSPDLNTEDRRSVPRCPCNLKLTYVGESGVSGEAKLIDVSSKGIQIETDHPLNKNTAVALNSPQEQELEISSPLMTHVIWSNPSVADDQNFRSGLALPDELEDEPTWLDSLLESLGYSYDGSQRRRHIRAEAAIAGKLILDEDSEARTHDVSVLNLGMGGALIKAPDTLEKNQQFSLTVGPYRDLPEINLSGTILRIVGQTDDDHILHPSRFRPLEERDEKLLREYILELIGSDK